MRNQIHNSLRLQFFRILFLLCFTFLFSCATTHFEDYPRNESSALTDTQDTSLGKVIAPAVETNSGKSGYYLVTDGIEALAARLILADKAERSIDTQYYLLYDDMCGFLFVNALLKAADRGVRVRILLDDMTTKGYDAGMAAFESHPNIELRIFNPFHKRKVRAFSFLTDFSRVNHRMHNKSFTVDNQITIVGGRNIGNEYFDASQDVNDADLDLISIGPVVNDVSKHFDIYWNNQASVPALALVNIAKETITLDEVRERFSTIEDEALETQFGAALDHTIQNLLDRKEFFTWASGKVIVDPPDKIQEGFDPDTPGQIRTELSPEFANAEKEIFAVSPYFVPREQGLQAVSKLRKKGVKIIILTNSLHSNDVQVVHAGYSKYRKHLLEMGVELWEARTESDYIKSLQEEKQLGYSQAGLHAKAFSMDERYAFIGSFNWDPRSIDINTEMGIYLDSPEITKKLHDEYRDRLADIAYRVRLNGKGNLEWVYFEHGKEVIYTKEPKTSWWTRFKIGLVKLLPIENQL